MKRKLSGSAVPRHYVFVLQDGTVVIQWAEQRVQDIMTGQFMPYKTDDFGRHITDVDLQKLKAAGRVEHFTSRFIWLYSIPSGGRIHGEMDNLYRSPNHVRVFYIMTSIPIEDLQQVHDLLVTLSFARTLEAQERHETVAIYATDKQTFISFQEATDILHQLKQAASPLFNDASVAFFEVALKDMDDFTGGADDDLDLDLIIESQSDVSLTEGKLAVVIGFSQQDEKVSLNTLLEDSLKMQVEFKDTIQGALSILEDIQPALALIDLNLPEHHGWTLVKKIREIRALDNLIILITSDDPSDEVLALKVAKTSGYIGRPLNYKKLREKIWFAFRDEMPPT